MKLQKDSYWPVIEKFLADKAKLQSLVLQKIAKQDIDISNVSSFFNICYTKDKNNLQSYDKHIASGTPNAPIVIYIHGGAWLCGGKELYTPFCKQLSSFGFDVYNINYRMLRAVEIEDCYADCVTAIKYILNKAKNSKDKINLFLVGDSAGAHLASLIAGKLTNGEEKLPSSYILENTSKPSATNNENAKPIKLCGCGLYYGVYDLTKLNRTDFPILKVVHKRNVKLFDRLTKQSLQKGEKFIKTTDSYKKSKLFAYYKSISPVTYVTKLFPPTFITSGKIDKLNSQTMLFIKFLKHHYINYSPLIFPLSRLDGTHAFLNFTPLKSAKQAFEQLVRFFFSCI